MRFRFLGAAVAAVATVALGVGVAVGAKSGGHDGVLSADMNGKKEVSAQTGKKGAGDPDGAGGFTAVIDGTQFCYGITVKNISPPTAAHIHIGQPNEAGPVVIPLTPPSSGDPGASSGCTSIAPDLAAAIAKNPHKYYVNVHTADFPGGAVRGQLEKE
jgi:hypothetical protein